MYKKISLWISGLFFLVGCTGMVGLNSEQQAMEIAAQKYRFSSINISLADGAVTTKSTRRYFDKEEFLQSIQKQFDKHGLIQSKSNLNLEIIIKRVKIRSQLNALLPLPGNDKIEAQVAIQENGKVLDKFKVNSSYALGGTANALAIVRTHLLYSNFSKMTSDLFTGNYLKQDDDF